VKIKSDTDLHVTTTWGASIFLAAGEEREVGDDLGLQAQQQGAVKLKKQLNQHRKLRKLRLLQKRKELGTKMGIILPTILARQT
jgi:hypothetical protein